MLTNVFNRMTEALSELDRLNRAELAGLLRNFSQIVIEEKSDNLDKEALLVQTLILAEQAALPRLQRKKLLVTSALIYIGLFSSVKSIGTFLIENRDRLDSLFDEVDDPAFGLQTQIPSAIP